MVFWNYCSTRSKKKHGEGARGEFWLTPEKFQIYRERARVNARKRSQENPDENAKKLAQWKIENPEKYKSARYKNHRKHYERRKSNGLLWHQKNRKLASQKSIQWEKDNREKKRAIGNRYKKKRYANDPAFRLKIKFRNMMRRAFKKVGSRKNASFVFLLGCDFDFLLRYIESQFAPGMSWKNHAHFGWHIDHKIPLSSARTVEDMARLCHHTNLRPLWWRENIIKGDKILPEFEHPLVATA